MSNTKPAPVQAGNSSRGSTIDLGWLGSMVADLKGIAVDTEPDLFEILTYGSLEQVNSNILAFYLDREGHHGFKDLFIVALRSAIREAWKEGAPPGLSLIGSGNYTVQKEYPAGAKRIDLLILGKAEEDDDTDMDAEPTDEKASWAVIIENKLYAGLYNDLDAYWKAAKADPDRKFGVILSLHPVSMQYHKKHEKNFVNVLHRDLMAQVKHHLKDYYEEANDRHLLILKEYLRSITSHYKRDTMDLAKEADLALVQKKEPEIKKLNEHIRNLKRYVMDRFGKVMREFCYDEQGASRSLLYRHYYSSNDLCQEREADHAPYFRFYIAFSWPLFHDKLEAYFELYGEHTRHGDALKAKIQAHYGQDGLQQLGLKLGTGGKIDGGYYHLAYMDGSPLNSNGNLEEAIRRKMGEGFFKEKNGFVRQCTIWMKELTTAQ